jgi:quinol monooxygenase YgiN
MNAVSALWKGLIEHVTLRVDEDAAPDFEAAIAEHGYLLAAAPGFLGMLLFQDEERSSSYVLLIGWRDAQDRFAFRASPGYQRWRAAVHGYFAELPSVDHLKVAHQLPPNYYSG